MIVGRLNKAKGVLAMEIRIYSRKEYGTLNAYDVTGKNGTELRRTGCANNARFDGRPAFENKYTVIGHIGGKFIGVRCVDYASARALFNAMEQQ